VIAQIGRAMTPETDEVLHHARAAAEGREHA
jgi:hypothetical protein